MKKNLTSEQQQAYTEMGKRNEQIYQPILEEYFNTKLTKDAYEYARIDFYNNNFKIELKSKTFSSTDKKDLKIGLNKIEYLRKHLNKNKNNPNYKCYVAVGYTDGFFLWEFNENNYQKNGGDTQIEPKEKGTDDWDNKDHYIIKCQNLIKINNTPCYIPDILKKKDTFNLGKCLLKLPNKRI